jgi:D-arabinose 1-dehydrogenase-like Zn-dependent alcohol dehydrogenase
MAEWVVVATYGARAVAEMMAELLRNQGIAAIVSVDDAGGLRPELALTLGAKVRVHAEDEERARLVLEHGGEADED